MARREIVLLVTGFGPFPGAPVNPSARLARGLDGAFVRRLARLGVRLETRILEVEHAAIAPALARLEADLAPDAVLHFGLAARRRIVTVETRAANRNRPFAVDARKRLPEAPTLDVAGPPMRRATAPVRRLIAALDRVTPARASIDAGAYVCNSTLWRSLAEAPAGRPVAFVHIPPPRKPHPRKPHPRKPHPRKPHPRSQPGAAPRPTRAALARMAQAACFAMIRAARAVTPLLVTAPAPAHAHLARPPAAPAPPPRRPR